MRRWLPLLALACTPPAEPLAPFAERGAIDPREAAAREGAIAVSAFDADGDGDLDLLVPRGFAYYVARPDGLDLLLNDGRGKFTRVEAGFDTPRIYSNAIAFDYDGDGDLDVYATALEASAYYDGAAARDPGPSGDGFDVLYRNEGGRFVDVTQEARITERGNSWGAAAGDIDGDGDLDLFVSEMVDADLLDTQAAFRGEGPVEKDFLFVNQGDGTFAEEAGRRGLNGPSDRLGYVPLMFDADGDLDLDLVVPQDFGRIALYLNDGRGWFEDASDRVEARMGTWMACAPFDWDEDGDFDLACDNSGTAAISNPLVATSFPSEDPAISPYAALLENRGGGRFVDIAKEVTVTGLPRVPWNVLPDAQPTPVGFERMPWGWGLSAGDIDADGREDLYQTGSFAVTRILVVGSADQGASPGVMLRRTEQGFEDVTNALGLANLAEDGYVLPSWGNVLADLDGDGFLDVVIANHRTAWREAGVRVFANPGNRHGRVQLRLRGRAPNHHGVGAVVEAHSGGRVQRRVVTVGGWGGAPMPVHFGLGDDALDRVVVRWPSGAVETIEGVESAAAALVAVER